jgi:hypothetical protein
MRQSFTIAEIEEAKNILVQIVVRNMAIDKVKNDKDLDTWTKGRNEPNKKDKQISNIIDIFARLDGYDMLPGFLMTSGFVKRAPELHDPEDNVENVSHKVKMLETVVVNLANKLSEETRVLKEDSKAIRSEIKSLKPSFAELFKNREVSNHPSGRDLQPAGMQEETPPLERRPKRSRTGDGIANTSVQNMETQDEVFEEGFQAQNRRGFLGTGSNGQRPADNLQPGTQPAHDGQGGRGQHQGGKKLTWRSRLPNITGASKDVGFAAPVDLFVYNVNKDVTEEAITNHMKSSKELDIIECKSVSHVEARTKSFRIKVKAEDYEKAMNGETWPYRVRVRPYKHFKQKHEQSGGQFGGMEIPRVVVQVLINTDDG